MSPGKRKIWSKAIHAILRVVMPLGISALLIWCFFREVDWAFVKKAISEGCNLWLIGLSLVMLTLSSIFRGIRWGIQLRGVGIPRMPPVAECCTMFGAWALNIIFPRLGEGWRCVYVSRRQKWPLMTVVGTDLGDRTADLVCVIIFVFLALLFTRPELLAFVHRYSIGRDIDHLFSNVWLWVAVSVVVGVLWALMEWFGRWVWVQDLHKSLKRLWDGIAVLVRMPQIPLYLWLTLGIWVTYFLETYICFYAFPFTREMCADPSMAWGLKPGLLCMVFGICSTAVPSNGGLGPWTLATAFALQLVGLPQYQATAYALVVWFFQTIMLIILGIFTAIYIARCRRRGQQSAASGAAGFPQPPLTGANAAASPAASANSATKS